MLPVESIESSLVHTSYKYSEVSLVTPLKYLALVFAIIFGYLFWYEIPTLKTLIGSLLTIAFAKSIGAISGLPQGP